MADEGLFEFLHSEIVNYITSKNENDKNTKVNKSIIMYILQ